MCPSFLGILVASALTQAPATGSYLCQPSYSRDWETRGPLEWYSPQPGDIFLATDQRLWFRWGHLIAGANGFHHSGLVFRRADGRLGLIEAGPFNKTNVEVMDPYQHMMNHVQAGDRVWIRRRKVPLTPEQSARLTDFATAQEGKPFALARWFGQLTPLRTRGPIKTWFVGEPIGDRPRWFCSELVTECCAYAGIMDRKTARPSATYPADFFYPTSFNLYLNKHLRLEDQGWAPPSRWLPAIPEGVELRRPAPSPQK
ncbi:hypothetical protein OJF2_25760 [Aquisphaera giovannonii]|uniref:Permuted papain-like amidase enzyme, YaeF/YiiX, C92 family n=1 Tax=Aquisphaera giovannonii TaxID=406548 RepID=A0A5B9W0I3_9BACT|nr:hypothetical protein [Aquisphaera giovannonii]QEH34043.1 hypothetical protein OJF2_25760 [Aquisphaera giovannonii]